MTIERALDRAAILARRAELLAATARQVEAAGLDETVMILRLGADRFALPLSDLLQVLPKSKLALVPGAPPEVAGLMQVQGEIRPVYHLLPLLGLASSTSDAANTVLLLRHPAGDFGIAVDDVEGVRAVAEKSRRLIAQAKGHAGWTTEDHIPVLSVELLLEEKE